MAKLTELKWIGIDLDQTLSNTSPYPEFKLGTPTEGAIEFVNKIVEKGFKPIVFTARPWDQYNEIEDWLNEHNIPHRRIICGKPLFYAIIDDKNIAFKGDWDECYNQLGI